MIRRCFVAALHTFGGVEQADDVAVVKGLVDGEHAAAGTPSPDLKAAGIEVHLPNHTFKVSIALEPPADGGSEPAANDLAAPGCRLRSRSNGGSGNLLDQVFRRRGFAVSHTNGNVVAGSLEL